MAAKNPPTPPVSPPPTPAPKLYGFAYAECALKFLEGVPKKFRRQIVEKIKALSANPRPDGVKMLNGVKDGEQPVFRERSGDYRILFSIREPTQTIAVLDIDNRKDVYR